MPTLADRTARFRQLHQDGLLLLANAWDAGTARLIDSLGVAAVATTSAGVAWAHGYADGDRLPVARLLAAVEDIARIVHVPLTLDIESGYSDESDAVAGLVMQLAQRGVSGINLEDGGADPAVLCAKIQRIKAHCADAGMDVFVNARTDVYLRQLAPAGEARVQASLERASRYREAGADGLFVPGVVEAGEIGAIAARAGLPLNVLWRAALPDMATLQALGVRRLSAGSDLAQSMYGHLRRRTQDFLTHGTAMTVDAQALNYSEINALFP